MSADPLNFYFLSSGFCGTRLHYHVLRLATNAEVWHQPGHEDISEITELLEQRFEEDPVSFLRTEIAEFPLLRRRIDKRLALPWIYGDTLNWMRALGHMLYSYIGPERLRLVQLVRHPTAACRSMLTFYRASSLVESSDVAMAEEMARRWVRQYSLIRCQFEAIDDPQICKTIRLEDTDIEQLRTLYNFLNLKGFDEAAISGLLRDRSMEVRHSHLNDSPVAASKEELQVIWRLCGPLAEQYGYVEEQGFYDSAPSRPAGRPAPPVPPQAESRSPRAKLLDYRGLGLIIRCPSGISYINQAGGPICFWLNAEGAFVPLAEAGEGSAAQKLFGYFHRRRNKEFMSRIGHEDAEFIDGLLAEQGMGFITVNRSRIGEEWDLFSWETWGDELNSAPWEAWVPVRVAPTNYDRLSGVLSGVDTGDAILVWENSN